MRERGFTLIELIMVMVILAIVATGVTSFLRFGSQIFSDVASRDTLLSSSRFVVERLNRELRAAVPNSIRVVSNASSVQCIEFVPINSSTYYDELPVFPDASTSIRAIYPADYTPSTPVYALVYPVSVAEVYDSSQQKRALISAIPASDPQPALTTITLASSFSFAGHSPARRLYIINQPVSYCLRSGQLWRYQDYGYLTNQSLLISDLGSGVLMAENLQNDIGIPAEQPFSVANASLTRNGYVRVLLQLGNDDERVELSNEIHIVNAP